MAVLAAAWRRSVYGALFFFVLSSVLSWHFLDGGDALTLSYSAVAIAFWLSFFLIARRVQHPSREWRSFVTFAPLLLYGVTVLVWIWIWS